MKFNRSALSIIIVAIFVFIAAVGPVKAETFCPEGGERFAGNEKFCPNHGAALKPVDDPRTAKSFSEALEQEQSQDLAVNNAEDESGPAKDGSEEVAEILNGAGSTYLRVTKGAKQDRWVAAPQFAVKLGDSVEVPGSGMEMPNYESKTLGRYFDSVTFVDGIKVIEETDQMIKSLQVILEKDNDNYEAWVQFGNRSFDIGKSHKAIMAYKEALKLNWRDVAVMNDLAVMYRRIGESKLAVDLIHKSLELDHTNKYALYNLGMIYRYDLNDPQGAVKAWKKLLEYHPDVANGDWVRNEITTLEH